MAEVHKKKFKCDICLKEFDYQSRLNTHMFTHSKIKCHFEACEKTFTDPSALRRHISTMHNNFKFKCDVCDEEFKYRYELIDHFTLTHEKSKSSNCKDCGKSYKNSHY